MVVEKLLRTKWNGYYLKEIEELEKRRGEE
jgi:hypothetical protein